MSADVVPSATPARRQRHYTKGLQRRRQIVDAATDVFGEFGYTGGSIRTIAERVDTSPATLIQYFGSKEGLLEAVLDNWADQHNRHAKSADVTGLAFINSMRDVMRYHLAHRGLIELFLTMAIEASSATHPARPFIQHRYETTLQGVQDQLQVAVDAGEIGPMSPAQMEAEARQLFAVMDGLEVQWLLDPSIDLAGLFDRYLDARIESWTSDLTQPD